MIKQDKQNSKVSLATEIEDNVLSLEPKTYTERNLTANKIANLLSYPLQIISVLAGAYMIFSIALQVFSIEIESIVAVLIGIVALFVFIGIEYLRRLFVDNIGEHYIASSNYLSKKHQSFRRGEWLYTKTFWLVAITLITVSSGTYGVYQASQDIQPAANTYNIKAEVSPTANKITRQEQIIKDLQNEVSKLQNQKASELADAKSYNTWKGNKYLKPVVAKRHQNYDAQIQSYQNQITKHTELLAGLEGKLTSKENKLTDANVNIESKHKLNSTTYAIIGASIWFIFEIALVFCLAYVWSYKFNVAKHKHLSNYSKPQKQTNQVYQTSTKQTNKVYPKKYTSNSNPKSKPVKFTTIKNPKLNDKKQTKKVYKDDSKQTEQTNKVNQESLLNKNLSELFDVFYLTRKTDLKKLGYDKQTFEQFAKGKDFDFKTCDSWAKAINFLNSLLDAELAKRKTDSSEKQTKQVYQEVPKLTKVNGTKVNGFSPKASKLGFEIGVNHKRLPKPQSTPKSKPAEFNLQVINVDGHKEKPCKACSTKFKNDAVEYCPNTYNVCKNFYNNRKKTWKSHKEKGKLTGKHQMDFDAWYQEIYLPKNKNKILEKKAKTV